ncbi:MAG: metal ABC transporter substrate-binding protein [Eubacterium sp.]
MKKTKKYISLLLVFCCIFAFTACSQGNTEKSEKLKIVCTIFPEYDWVREILKSNPDNTELTLLIDNGVDLHNYQPTADDIITVSNCDMFIYVGGESDKWVDDVLSASKNEDLVTVNLLDSLGSLLKEEEIKEGMQTHEDEDEDEEEEAEYDEHIWLSLKNAKVLCQYLCEKICEIDNENAQAYKANTESYITQLEDLDNRYQAVFDNAKTKTVLFGDRFPFRYLTDDYGLDYYAAFVGCSAETEASFETISFLSGKIDELGLNTVLTIEGSDCKIAQTIIDNTKSKNQNILSLNSMQGTVNDNDTYITIMESNLEVLKTALS